MYRYDHQAKYSAFISSMNLTQTIWLSTNSTYTEKPDHRPQDMRMLDRLCSSADLLSLCDILGSTCGQLDGDILVTHLYTSSSRKVGVTLQCNFAIYNKHMDNL